MELDLQESKEDILQFGEEKGLLEEPAKEFGEVREDLNTHFPKIETILATVYQIVLHTDGHHEDLVVQYNSIN